MSDLQSSRPWSSRCRLLLPALLYTLLNVPKPLLVDDAAYYYFARQLAQDPLRPYGFEMFWYQWPQPANHILAPPVLPWWWSLGLRLFGERPWLWKLWLFPFAWLLVWALHTLSRRLAKGMEGPLVWLTVFSPSFLPSFNLMLDVPALALGLTALAWFMRSFGRRSLRGALVAGLLAGLAMQTKYTAFVVPAVMGLYALFLFPWSWRRWLVTGLAISVAWMVFVSWELFVAWQHGQSHFAANRPQDLSGEEWWTVRLQLALALLPMLGGLAPTLALLGLTALRWSRLEVGLIGALIALGYGAVALVAVPPVQVSEQAWLFWPLEQGTFGSFGLLVSSTLGAVAAVLCRRRADNPGKRDCQAWFLLVWFVSELAAYFLLSPFPAARRVMGLVVTATLLIGRLAARTCRLPRCRQTVRAVVLSGGCLGLLFYVVDLIDAFTARNAVAEAVRSIAELSTTENSSATVWYVGHWGFQFYAERAGMKAVVPDRSLLQPGDWLVIPEAASDYIARQEIVLEREQVRTRRVIHIRQTVPLRTVMCYYGGYVPLQHHAGPRLRVTLYQVTTPWLVRSDLG